MPMTASDIVEMIKEAIPDAQVEITDLRGDGDHYSAVVTSQSFKGKTRVQQHRMVYDAFHYVELRHRRLHFMPWSSPKY